MNYHGRIIKLLPLPSEWFTWVDGRELVCAHHVIKHPTLDDLSPKWFEPCFDPSKVELVACHLDIRKFTCGPNGHHFYVTDVCKHGHVYCFNATHADVKAALDIMAGEKIGASTQELT